MTIYFSDTINNLERGHAHFEFVDIKMHSDTRLFIDPSLIKVLKDAWCKEANRVIDSYFDALYEAYRSCDEARINRLLSFAQEIRNTHLGYGRTIQGHGNTADGLAEKLSCLGDLTLKIDSISSAADLPIFIDDFDKDGLSDMITNIIHQQLNNFTVEQMMKLGKAPNTTDTFHTWSVEKNDWVQVVDEPSYTFGGEPVLLVPKRIVQKNYLYRAEHFLQQVILERIQRDEAYTDSSGKTRYPYKKDLEAQIDHSSEGWRKEFIVDYATNYPDTLVEYHNRTSEFYANRKMLDDKLDLAVYGTIIPS